MGNTIYNYSAFYVAEPIYAWNLGACTAPDFRYYNLLKAWKSNDSTFPFQDAHSTTYSVRDGSDWEQTLKPRLHQRLRNSKNIILFLSSNTKYSRALKEEIDYGINELGLPVIVVYPDFEKASDIAYERNIHRHIKLLWDSLPVFRDNMSKVPTVHIPLNKELISRALNDNDFTIQHKSVNYCWSY